MNLGPTEPYTTGFGAVPKPEEPARDTSAFIPPSPRPNTRMSRPSPHHPYPWLGGSPEASRQYQAANATVVNNIRFGGPYGRRGCNHLLHGSLTVLTCGLWAPVWFFAWLGAR
jgi:hypothetical protein